MKKKGVLLTILFYSGILVTTYIVHQIVGWKNTDTPPVSFFVFIMLLFVGICLALYNWINTLSLTKGDFHKGAFLVHKLFFGAILLFVFGLAIITYFIPDLAKHIYN